MITPFTPIKTIPKKITTRKSSPTTTNFAKGIYTYKPNDTMDFDEIRLAQDARFDRAGEYITRRGFTKLSEPIGKAQLSSNVISSPTMTPLANVQPYTFTTSSNTLIYSIKVKLSTTDTSNYAVPMLTISVGGEKVTSSCVDPALISGTTAEYEVIFMDAPSVASGESVSISIGTQDGRASSFSAATVDNATLMCQVNTCTAGAITGVFEANIEGVKTVLFVQNSILYRMAEDGTITQIRQLPDGATKLRFTQNLNQVRYADGKEGPRLLDPADGWSDTAIQTIDLDTETDLNIKVSNVMNGAQADNLIYFNADVDTEAVWTWPYGYEYSAPYIYQTTANLAKDTGSSITTTTDTIEAKTSKPVSEIAIGDRIYGSTSAGSFVVGEVTDISGDNITIETINSAAVAINSYDKFCFRFYQNFPAILTGDPITAMFNLGGVYYFLTRRNKYQMYAQEADTWSQGQCNAQNGTFSQESVVCDLNYAYFASDSGIYQFDGSSEYSLTQNTIQNVYDAIPNKENIRLDMFNNRLYVFYTNTPGGVNDHCLVYNTKLRVWESFDSNTFVSASSGRQNASNRFICGHSRIGMLMLAEDTSNNYNDMGQPIAFNLETAYYHFGATSQLKRITKWRPEFGSVINDYAVQCGYALNFTDEVRYAFSVNLKRQTVTGENYVWDNPDDYHIGDGQTVHTTIPQVYKDFYRCQIRYQHIAAFEPVNFKSHTLTVQTQRIR